jgi:hypothetical protein
MAAQTTARRTGSTYPTEAGPDRRTGWVPDAATCGAATRRVRWRAVRPSSRSTLVTRARHLQQLGTDAGMATAEYAIATLAAVGFAGLLVVILKGNEVKSMLMALVRQALSS